MYKMKKILYIILIIALFSCEKDDCYLCITTYTHIKNKTVWKTYDTKIIYNNGDVYDYVIDKLYYSDTLNIECNCKKVN